MRQILATIQSWIELRSPSVELGWIIMVVEMLFKRNSSCLFFMLLFVACTPAAQTPIRTGPSDLRQLSISTAQKAAELGANLKDNMSDKDFLSAAKDAISRDLKDPSSVQFRSVTIVDAFGGKIVCGELNGKNSYGAYVGFKPFYAVPVGGGQIWATGSRYPSIDRDQNAGIVAACG